MFKLLLSPKICHGSFVCEDRVELTGDITIGISVNFKNKSL
jgi:hypothetical protein